MEMVRRQDEGASARDVLQADDVHSGQDWDDQLGKSLQNTI